MLWKKLRWWLWNVSPSHSPLSSQKMKWGEDVKDVYHSFSSCSCFQDVQLKAPTICDTTMLILFQKGIFSDVVKTGKRSNSPSISSSRSDVDRQVVPSELVGRCGAGRRCRGSSGRRAATLQWTRGTAERIVDIVDRKRWQVQGFHFNAKR